MVGYGLYGTMQAVKPWMVPVARFYDKRGVTKLKIYGSPYDIFRVTGIGQFGVVSSFVGDLISPRMMDSAKLQKSSRGD